jgi:hypothetical protein
MSEPRYSPDGEHLVDEHGRIVGFTGRPPDPPDIPPSGDSGGGLQAALIVLVVGLFVIDKLNHTLPLWERCVIAVAMVTGHPNRLA